MKYFSKTQKGFTLVELLIVIAIIGILATILIVSLRQASDKSRNAKIITNVVQVRKVAEQIYVEEMIDGYTNLCQDSSTLNLDYTDLGLLQADIEAYASVVTCYAGIDSYCVSATLRGTGDRYICVDDEGNSAEVTGGNPCLSSANTCQ